MAAHSHKRAARHGRVLARAAALALALHLGALGSYVLTVRWAPPASPAPEEIMVHALDEAASRALLAVPAEAPALASPAMSDTQVVRQRGDERPPAVPTRFIAEQDADPGPEDRVTVPSPASESSESRSLAPARKTRAASSRRAVAHAQIAPPGRPVASPLPPAADPATGRADPPSPERPSPEPPSPEPPSPEPARAAGASDDGSAGDRALVPARRSVLAAFIIGVQGRVRDNWRPQEVYRLADPSLRGLSEHRRRTELQVSVGHDGRLESARVATSSGMPELDEEALAACQRAQPFSRPPPEVLDASGRLTFNFGFELDMAEAAYRVELSEAVRAEWRPSPALRAWSNVDRTTIIRVLLTFDGVLVHAALLTSCGLDVLDRSALAALKHGLHLPRPPPGMGELAGLVPLRLAFMHSARGTNDVRVMREIEEPAPR
jgi:TonB family protein